MVKKDKVRQIKEFAIGLCVILFIIGVLPVIKKEAIRWWAIYLSLVVLLVRFLMPKLLLPVYAIFLKITRVIGKINSVILLGIVYYFIITPTGILVNLFRKCNFSKGFGKALKSYWIIRDKQLDDPRRMEKQF